MIKVQKQNKSKIKTKNIARAILLFSTLMLFLFFILEQKFPNYIIFPILVAFFEASMVGGIADLFAIHVLFKKPFGLNIPHTEIIPKSKERIGKALSDFFRDNFLSEEYVKENINKYIISEKIGLIIEKKKVYILNQLIRIIICGLKTFDYKIVKNFLCSQSENFIKNIDFKRYLISFLSDIQNKKQHYVMFNYFLIKLHEWLENPENNLKVNKWIENAIKSDGHGGTTFFGSIKSAFMGKQDLAASVKELIDNLNSPEGEIIKAEINKVFSGLIIEVQKSPMIKLAIDEIRDTLIQNGNIEQCIEKVISDINAMVEKDLFSVDSKIRSYLTSKIDWIIFNLKNNKIWIDLIQEKSNQYLPELIIKNGSKIDNYIVEYINKLDAKEVSILIEEKVGDDLQYIRINGSIVGGLAGLTIFFIKMGISFFIFSY